MKRLIFFLALAAAVGLTRPALADGPAPLPPFVTTTGIGWTTLDTSQLVETGTVEVPPPAGYPFLQFNVPGTGIQACIGCMTYNTYTDSSGQYNVVVPDIYTATVLASTGSGPFSQEPVYTQTSDALTASLLLTGGFEKMGISNQEAIDGYLTTIKNVYTLSPGAGTQTSLASDPFMLVRLMAANIASDGPNRFVVGSGYFVYAADEKVGSCYGPPCGNMIVRPPFLPSGGPKAATPAPRTGTPAPRPTPDVRIENHDVDCPRDPAVSQADPAATVQVRKIAPEHPVVAGQDPARTGVTFSLSLAVPPVFYSYNVKNSHSRCEGSGCGQAPGAGPVTIINWETCDRVTERYTDRLASLTAAADLTQASIAWIQGELAARYPGAHVFQDHWPLLPGIAGSGGGLGTAAFSMTWSRVPFLDPGRYVLSLTGATTGTPVSPPRPFSWAGEAFQVELIETGLIK